MEDEEEDEDEDEAARLVSNLVPHTGALHATEARTRAFEAPLKRDMNADVCQ